jgi:hypothetical protein
VDVCSGWLRFDEEGSFEFEAFAVRASVELPEPASEGSPIQVLAEGREVFDRSLHEAHSSRADRGVLSTVGGALCVVRGAWRGRMSAFRDPLTLAPPSGRGFPWRLRPLPRSLLLGSGSRGVASPDSWAIGCHPFRMGRERSARRIRNEPSVKALGDGARGIPIDQCHPLLPLRAGHPPRCACLVR